MFPDLQKRSTRTPQSIIASIGFALFILCPRMAGMANVIANATKVNLVLVSVIGTVISLPLIVAMVLIFRQWGLWASLAFAVLTDVLAALVMGAIRAGNPAWRLL